MKEALAYALQIVDGYLSFLPGGSSFLQGKTVLELGPGREFGPALIMAGFGARMILADKYLASWDRSFHPDFYCQLHALVVGRYPGIDTTPLEDVIRNANHATTGLQCLREGLEDLHAIPSSSVDVTFSNAVFEHLYDAERACMQLGRLSKSGAYGFHQIDFRDHRDFNKPLEYITLKDDDFKVLMIERHGECGNRLRYFEFQHFLENSGFEILRLEKNMFSNEQYLADVIGRAQPRYRKMDREFLHVLSGRFYIRKK